MSCATSHSKLLATTPLQYGLKSHYYRHVFSATPARNGKHQVDALPGYRPFFAF